jgi:hypothetical protein
MDKFRTTTSPHQFKPLRWWDRLRQNGHCFHCLLPQSVHPVNYWAPARALGDKSKAETSWEDLDGKGT